MDRIAIRRLTDRDWRLFREVRLRALQEAPSAFGSTAADAQVLGEDDWRRRLAARAAFVALEDERGVGLVAGIPADSRQEAELVSMWVDPSRRRQGVGAKLVEAVVTWATAEGFEGLRLWVANGNGPAEHLYAGLGFVRTGEVQAMGKQGSGAMEFAMLRRLG